MILSAAADLFTDTVGSNQDLGIYVAVSGPNFETPAELRMLRGLGADAVAERSDPFDPLGAELSRVG